MLIFVYEGEDPALLTFKESSSEVSQTQPAEGLSAEIRLGKFKPFSLRTIGVIIDREVT